jgi:uncharacterized protein (TIGR03437 family)
VLLICVALVVCLASRRAHTQAGALRRITHTPEQALNLNPTLSGDGQHIAFESTENLAGAPSASGFHALRADIGGAVPAFAQLASSRAVAPALSQDGARTVFASTGDLIPGHNLDGNAEIFLAAQDQLQQLTTTTPDDPALRVAQGNFAPSMSDDGELIAFASNRDLIGANPDANLEIFIYDVTRRSFTQITNTTGIVGASDAKLSGDGTGVAYISDRRARADGAPFTRDLKFYQVTTGRTRILVTDARALTFTPGRAVSDDGTRIAYAAETAANTTQVYLYDARNNAVRQLTTLGARVTDVPLNATISGDGARIAFATRRNVVGGNSDGSVELYAYDIPANRFTRLTSAPATATAEVVSSLNDDGSLVAFNFPRVLAGAAADADLANNSEIFVTDIAPPPPFATDLRLTHGAAFGHEPAAVKALAPDQIAIATGRNLALVSMQTERLADGSFPRSDANVTLSVNGRSAELLYVSPTQVNFVVPSDIESGMATVSVRNHDGYESRGNVMIVPAAPGVFTEPGDGTGAAIALEANTFLRPPFDPVDGQNNPRRLIIFATGVRHATDLTVSIGGHQLTIETVAPSPDLSGLDEIHVLLTSALRGAGVVPLVVRANGRDSNPTTLRFSGVRRAASITLAPVAARVGVGRSLRLLATVRDEAGVVIADAPVTFNSSAPDIARVDADGTVHGLLAGTTIIRATVGDSSATAQLEVYPLTLVINEVLADPPDGATGDANHDGVRSAAQDEFIEIVNASAQDYDLGGYQLLTRTSGGTDSLRHLFAVGTILPPGTALVVFGGAETATFNPNDPVFGAAQVFTASTGGLSLLNGGSTITLLDASGTLVEQMSYGDAVNLPGDNNQSLTRAPDITGDFTPHQQVADSNGRVFSPGTHTDGTPFIPTAPIARIEVAPASANIETGTQQQITAHAFDEAGRELTGVIFQWQTSNALVATIDNNGLARALAPGMCEITAQARGVRSVPAQLTVHESPPVLTRIEITPGSLTLPTGVQVQFTARAFDQRGQQMSGIMFTWASSDPQVATIDQTGLTNTIRQGAADITASARNVMGTALLNVSAPVLLVNEVLADPPDGAAGDANHDGTRSSTDDEFIELINASVAPLDLGGWTIRTHALTSLNETTRHTFAAGTTLPAGDAIVVFGGGSFDANNPAFGGAQVITVSSGGLALTNSGLTIVIRDSAGRPAAQFAYGTSDDDFGGDAVNQSITRAPDLTGTFMRHTLAPGAGGRKFSPGTKLDSSFFAPRTGRLTRVQLTPASAAVIVGGATQFIAQAFDQFDRTLPGATFTFTSSDTSIAAITDVTTDNANGRAVATVTGRNAGSIQIRATATDGANSVMSNEAVLQVSVLPPVVQRVVVGPASAALNRGQTQQFSAQAFDQNNQLVPTATFSWTTSDMQIASASTEGLARGVGLGAVNVIATTPDGIGSTISGQSMLTVQAPLVINEILADVPPDNTNTANVEGDANRDGVRSSDDDEFIELLNNSNAPLDLSGIVLADATSNRFTFPPNTTLEVGRCVVVFGGGAPPVSDPAFGGALIFTTGSLGLNDGGDTVTVKLPASSGDIIIAMQAFGNGASGAPPAPSDQALTRAPDAEIGTSGGSFIAHASAANANGRVYSPGTRADGTPFGSAPLTRIEVTPAVAQLDIGARQSFSAHAFSSADGVEAEVANVSFIWAASDTTKANLAPATGVSTEATALATGTTNISAQAGSRQTTATLTINPPPPVLTRVELTPTSAAIIVNQTQQFTARAFDQFDHAFTGASYTFNADNTGVAQIESVTNNADGSADAIVRGLNVGTAHINATANSGATTVMSVAATLTVTPPPPMLTRIIVSPANATIAAGETQQFTAHGFDQNDQEVTGLTFAWAASNQSVATINQSGLATGGNAGTIGITASSGNVTSRPATLSVTAPPVPTAGQVIINEALVAFATSSTQTRNDFVELYNPTGQTLDISGLVISFRPAGNSNTPTTVTLPGAPGGLTTLIQPHGYFLIVNGADTFGVAADLDAHLVGFDLNNTTGGIKIELNGVKLDGLTYQGGATPPVATFIAYGEGTLLTYTSGTTNDLIRSPDATDTNNNATDFRRNGTAASVTPKASNPTLP